MPSATGGFFPPGFTKRLLFRLYQQEPLRLEEIVNLNLILHLNPQLRRLYDTLKSEIPCTQRVQSPAPK